MLNLGASNFQNANLIRDLLIFKRTGMNWKFCHLTTCKVDGQSQRVTFTEKSAELKIPFQIKPEKATNFTISCHGRDPKKSVTLSYTSPRTEQIS